MSAHTSFLLERKQGGLVVAFCEVLRGVDEAEILNIETLPSHRRQGLAHSLLLEALDWARANHRTSLWLEVRTSNSGAQALYAKLGFVTISMRQRYYADGADAFVMKYNVVPKQA
jgi:[ribosomal protein S18]-alanine N-acetyltransferase